MQEPANVLEWQKAAYQLSADKGWHTSPKPIDGIAKFLINLHGEVSEAWELARMPDFDPHKVWTDEKGKLHGFPTELADIVIRALNTAETFGIDLQAAMWQKHQYNATRPFRHGGKRA
jgi:hypothetical protein